MKKILISTVLAVFVVMSFSALAVAADMGPKSIDVVLSEIRQEQGINSTDTINVDKVSAAMHTLFFHGQNSACDHEEGSNEKRHTRHFTENQKGDQNPNKRRNRIIHAGSGSTQPALSPYIEKDAQAI